MQKGAQSELPVFIKWLEFQKVLTLMADRMPKKVRFTLTDRMINLSLNNVESLVEARYSKNKIPHLAKVNINIEKLRFLSRIGFEGQYVSSKDYERINIYLNETGQMIGAWIKERNSSQ